MTTSATELAALRERIDRLPDDAGAIRVAAPGSWAVITALVADLYAALELELENAGRCTYRGVEGDRCELRADHWPATPHAWPTYNAALSAAAGGS